MNYMYGSSFFIGETTGGTPSPVFWDPHTAVINNKPGATLITGGPGSGKTFFSLILTAISTLSGKTTVVIDPKGDFLNLENIKEDIGNYSTIDITKGKPGLLDPFYMAETKEKQMSLCIEVISIFLGGINDSQVSVLSPIIDDVINSKNPSLGKIVNALRSSRKAVAKDMGGQLNLIRKLEISKLCFSSGAVNRTPLKLDNNLTVFNLSGLKIPRGEMLNAPGVGFEERFGVGIMFLLTDYIGRVMNNEDSKAPKTIVIDEAHNIINTPQGARSITEMSLLGRSKYLALLLITQNSSHLKNLDIESTISSKFAFGSSMKESKSIIKDMNLPLDEGFETIIPNLEVGECLMKDFMDRYATVKIVNWNDKWQEAFTTNPFDKMKQERESEQKDEQENAQENI